AEGSRIVVPGTRPSSEPSQAPTKSASSTGGVGFGFVLMIGFGLALADGWCIPAGRRVTGAGQGCVVRSSAARVVREERRMTIRLQRTRVSVAVPVKREPSDFVVLSR